MMRRTLTTSRWPLVPMVLLGLIALATAGFAPPAPPSLFVDLAVGQPVTLDQTAGRWQIGVFAIDPPVALGYTVTKISPDVIVLDDVSGLKQIRIPSTAVSAVVVTRLQPQAQAEDP